MRPLAIITFFLAALAIAAPAEDATEEVADESRCIQQRYQQCLYVRRLASTIGPENLSLTL